MKRLFFALWPDQSIRKRCISVMEQLKIYGRPVDPNNLHVTLLFLGATDPEQEQVLSKAASKTSLTPITLVFDQISYWKKPAICCLSSREVDRAAILLAEQLRDTAVAIGMEVDLRLFKPHITLLRKSRSIPVLTIRPIVWQTNRFCLVESSATQSGVSYRVIESWQSTATE